MTIWQELYAYTVYVYMEVEILALELWVWVLFLPFLNLRVGIYIPTGGILKVILYLVSQNSSWFHNYVLCTMVSHPYLWQFN